jgi:hypothetical protein
VTWRHHLLATPLRIGLVSGVLFGIAMGVAIGVGAHSMLSGLVVGALGGPAFGVLFGRAFAGPMRALAGLPAEDRAVVLRTVQKGMPTTDRRLAPAVVGYAEAIRSGQRRLMGATGDGRRLFQLLAGLQVLNALLRALDGNWASAALQLVVGVMWLQMPRLNAKATERRDRAERSARELLASG